MNSRFLFCKFFILFSLTILPVFSWAQEKNVTGSEQIWLGYFNQMRLTQRSGIWFDAHFRFTDDFTDRLGVTIFRPGYTYYITDQTRLTAGYAYLTAYSASPETPDVPEHRPWQQIQWFDKRKHFSMMQYIRLEERFRRIVENNELTDDYSFNFRIRYNLSLTIPLKGKVVEAKTPFLFLSDEIMINFGKEIVYNYFDQNRFFAGIGYQFTKNLNAHIGYLNVFLQRPAGDEFIKTDAFRLFVFHNLDLRPKEK